MTSPSQPSLIIRVIRHYVPDWNPPEPNGREWQLVLCPFHDDSRPSASVSFEHDAFSCFACGEKGDVIGLIMRKEGIGYREAVSYAKKVFGRSHDELQGKPARKPARRIFGEEGAPDSAGESVQTGIRRRPNAWS